MFLRVNSRKKNGKLHRYWSVMESRRVAGQPVQRQVLYLGEINDSQEAAWRRSIEVFDEQKQDHRQISLFPDDRPIPPDEVNGLSLRLSEMRLERPRRFGDCWLGGWLWEELGLEEFWNRKLGMKRGGVAEQSIAGAGDQSSGRSGQRVHGASPVVFVSALDELLGCDFAVAAKVGCIAAWTASCRTRMICAGS